MPTFVPVLIYGLCVVTSCACSFLLGRQYVATRARLLMWSSACFFLLALNNLVVMLDLLVLTQIDLRVLRHSLSLVAVLMLIVGFIWEGES